ncbi:MAG: hypothetical protein GTO14_14350 [Anaerolineales bacterium]|nr:hypothetical protein [Anaerolineales bacterium]
MKNREIGHYVTFNLRVHRTGENKTFNGQVLLTDGRKVGLSDGSYIVRVWVEQDGELVRGAITHEQTGRSIRFQSGDRVAEFIRGCLADQEI